MLRHAQTVSPLFREVEANAHRRVPVTCSALPRGKLVLRRGFCAGVIGEKLAGSVASRAMAPLMTDGAETQSAGPAGKFAKLKVCCGGPTCRHLSTAKDTRLSAVRYALGTRSWTTRQTARLYMCRTPLTRSRGSC